MNEHLVCKTVAELGAARAVFERDDRGGPAARWWCHFDDDNYVVVDSLERLLSEAEAAQARGGRGRSGRLPAGRSAS
jgi:hypothetical protein